MRGPRVFLRPPTRADEAEFVAMVRRSRRHFGHFGRPPDAPRSYRSFFLKERTAFITGKR